MKDVPFLAVDGDGLVMDLYYPAGKAEGRRQHGERPPAVVMVHGYNDVGFERMLGSRFKDLPSTISWGQRMAALGMVAVAYTNRQPLADAQALLRHLREDSAVLGIDADRIALWACSGHGPVALSLLMSDRKLTAAALLYPYLMDLDGSTAVADAQRTFKFTNPCEGKSMDDLPGDRPLFIARAGKDAMPRLNEALDRFLAAALAKNLPVSLVNHAEAPHAFDLAGVSATSQGVIDDVLSFLTRALQGAI